MSGLRRWSRLWRGELGDARNGPQWRTLRGIAGCGQIDGSAWLDLAVFHADLAVGGLGDFVAVGDDHEGELARVAQAVKELDDLVLALAVEVAGRLVGQEEGWVVAERRAMATRWRWPTESCAGRMSAAVCQADFLDQVLGAAGALGAGPGASNIGIWMFSSAVRVGIR